MRISLLALFFNKKKVAAMKRIIKALFKPMEHVYCYLLILGLVSNSSVLIHDNSFFSIISILGLSVVTAYIEVAFYTLIPNATIKKLYLLVVSSLHGIICLTEYFLILNFQTIICQDIIDILGETNPNEIANFASAYLHPLNIILYLLAVISLNYAAWMLSKFVVRVRHFKVANFALLLFGMILSVYTCANFVLYRNGMSMPQRTSLTRLAYSYYIMKQRSSGTKHLTSVCQNAKVACITPPI